MKRLARELLDTLKAARLSQQATAWRRNASSDSQCAENLLQKSSDDDYRVKCDAARRHVYDSFG